MLFQNLKKNSLTWKKMRFAIMLWYLSLYVYHAMVLWPYVLCMWIRKMVNSTDFLPCLKSSINNKTLLSEWKKIPWFTYYWFRNVRNKYIKRYFQANIHYFDISIIRYKPFANNREIVSVECGINEACLPITPPAWKLYSISEQTNDFYFWNYLLFIMNNQFFLFVSFVYSMYNCSIFLNEINFNFVSIELNIHFHSKTVSHWYNYNKHE